jgi:hypothetical protein
MYCYHFAARDWGLTKDIAHKISDHEQQGQHRKEVVPPNPLLLSVHSHVHAKDYSANSQDPENCLRDPYLPVFTLCGLHGDFFWGRANWRAMVDGN